jgi:hypothetical protein
MGIFHDPMRAGIAILRALTGFNTRPDGPTVVHLLIVSGSGDEVCRVELSEDDVVTAVTVLEDAAAQVAQARRLAALEPSEWSAAAVAHNHSQLYADVQDVFDDIDPRALTATVLDHRQVDMPAAIEALDDVLGHLPDPYSDDDGD